MSDVSDDEGQSELKKRKLDLDPNDESAKIAKVFDDDDDGALALQFVSTAEFSKPDDDESTFKVKTLDVQDFANVIQGCCSAPGVEHVIMTFAPEGMELYARPTSSPTMAIAFFNKEKFTEYVVPKTIKRVITKARLESMKKKIKKDVKSLEITSWKEGAGFTFSGARSDKTGGECAFTFNASEVCCSIDVFDMSSIRWDYHIRTSSASFKANIESLDDSNEYIRIALGKNAKTEEQQLEFIGLFEGKVGETVDQPIEKNNILDEFSAMFQKQNLKIVTATAALNKSLVISFALDKSENQGLPIHFSYELDQAQPQSHFSTFVAPIMEEA